ncbi:hypothetical protein H0H81_000261 [Sphagnurus paluster]|uniref:Cytochrome P450 n=1 Tax=Sphagnurus paluster TaxID=117069 RepID=A0A9P7FQB0_9AGAR|nr:hypothetical protein H0H81_000261 [Sphagnurus paluster]
MVLYPQFQLRAQEELDRVLSAGRLPDFGDRASLPYLECIVQETLRAQEELDRVFGAGRLPTFADRASLPYVECIVQETLSMDKLADFTPPLGGIIPLLQVSVKAPVWRHTELIVFRDKGIPHRVSEDDVYDGMFISKGSVVVANIRHVPKTNVAQYRVQSLTIETFKFRRGMTWDEKIYTDAKAFNPERFLPKPEGLGEPLPAATWGFGRRICPGRYFADATLWIGIATMLSALTISKAVDAGGKEITPKVEFFTSITRYGVSTLEPVNFEHFLIISKQSPEAFSLPNSTTEAAEMLRQTVEALEDF